MDLTKLEELVAIGLQFFTDLEARAEAGDLPSDYIVEAKGTLELLKRLQIEPQVLEQLDRKLNLAATKPRHFGSHLRPCCSVFFEAASAVGSLSGTISHQEALYSPHEV